MTQHENADTLEALILEIQRMSTEDGPGIRTTVFFKGCSLKCSWCHNPESISPRPQVHWIRSRCIGCKTCLDVCPNGALSHEQDGVLIDRNVCEGCGSCAEGCPSNAVELLGKRWALESLIKEVIKDRAYFEKSGGGVTVSGGEPLAQARFVTDFLMGLKQAGIHTALDTCGVCAREVLDALLPHADMVLYDIKEIDSDRHRRFTGSSNEHVLGNLVHVSEHMRTDARPEHIWIRTPVIPEATAREDNIKGIGEFIASHLNNSVSRWELCSFNNLCRDKYVRLGLEWSFKDADLLTKEFMESLVEVARESGVNPDIVHWSGSVKLDDDDPGFDNGQPAQSSARNTC
ncbi:MAG: glycyl-radical enzyme activating protein [Candidatus Abyssobacteria bacterium SURF_17]|uniref:Glycyl-radical enzyme activating protein n=1 Tax=Candidatus Abyssobacteria bacterium SURF_17 TaxID=2093361 RepID=A0A419EP56_9BACT|nr:MAG: glycyl-radical enzyme activating protein [Candidatus Abyssubacteria bacterium SURF_17]